MTFSTFKNGFLGSVLKDAESRVLFLLPFLLVSLLSAAQQLNQNCTVSVLNRTVQVNSDGSWVIPNVPANLGRVRARATCVENGTTRSGQSSFLTIPANGVVGPLGIVLGHVDPVPAVLSVSASTALLTAVGQTAQLRVTSTQPNGANVDVTRQASGSNYTTSNAAVATVSPDGLVTAVSSGNAVISAMNEGALGVIAINVVLSGSSHGGIPDSWAIAHGLDPNDPAMPFEDPDHDGLNNLQEFQHGTDPHNPDTDGDGIPDGLEVALGGNPLNPNDFLSLLPRALKSIQVVPPAFTINVNTLLLEGSQQLIVTGTLIDLNATQVDLTPTRKGTNYNSSDLTVCNFGAVDGQIFGGNTGSCTITVTNSGFTTTAVGTVQGFTPSEVSALNVPGAVAVDVAGNFAYVAAGASGLAVVDITDRTHPFIRSTLSGLGNAQSVRVVGEFAFIADATGFLQVVHIVNPDAPSLSATLAIPGNPISVAVHSNLALIAAQAGGVSVVSVASPAAPTLLTTFPTPASVVGVDFDAQRNLAAVAMGTAGLQLVDITDPALPQALGSLPGGNVRRVLLKFPAALLADTQRSVTAVNITDAKNPVVTSSLASNLGGAPVDIASVGNIAITADVSFGRAIPIVNVINPLQPQALGFWRLLSPGFSSSVAMDQAFGYVTIPNTLRIFHYRILVDPPGTPPTASISTPLAGATVIERQTIPVTVIAADDVAVASVSLTVNGQIVDTLTSPPYQFSFQVPVGVSTVTLGALAVDLAGDTGKALPVQLNVIPDPGTTAVGKVVAVGGNPVAGASVSTFGGRSSITASDGSYSITQVPTVLGDITVTATFTQLDGSILKGISAPTPPVPLGITQVGTITVVPVPVITSMSRKSALAGTTVTFHITGTTLSGSKFSFSPASSPAITVPSSSIDLAGTSATLTVSVPARVFGTFALVATNIAGNSNTTITPVNRFTTVDPNSRADTDGDGFPDVVEAFFGTDPLDPNSIPSIPSLLGEAESASFVVLNGAGPGGQHNFEAESPAFTLLNSNGTPNATVHEAESPAFSVVNGAPTAGVTHEADSRPFSLQNAIPRTEAESLPFTVLNQFPSLTPVFHEADSMPFSVRNPVTPPPHVVSNFEAESALFSILNTNAASPGRHVFEIESASFSLLNTNSGHPGVSNFEAESPEFSVRNTIPPPVPGTHHFEADSLPFTLLNPSQPVQPTAREAGSPAFSLQNNSTSVNAAGANFEAESSTFTLLNSNGTPNPTVHEAESSAFTVVNGAPTAGVTHEADSRPFSLQNAIPRTEAESLPFTVLNQVPSVTPVFHEADSMPFSVRNPVTPPPHVVSNFEAESALFSTLNTNAASPGRHVFEIESASFSLLNTNSGHPGVSNFEAESPDFSVRNKIPSPVPGTQRFEADSLPFTLLNPSQPVQPTAQEADGRAFSLLNNSTSVNPLVTNFEAESDSFSLLNGAVASPRTFETASPMFSIRNTITRAAAKGSTTTEAGSKKQTKRPTRRQVPVASLRTISSRGKRAHSQTSGKGSGRSRAASPRPTVSTTASPVSERTTTNSNEQQRSQHVSPTLENQNQQ